jgi:cytochrome c biogenesis protein CcdA
LGILFALAFCPVSAALFFGSLIPLALKQNSAIGLPLIYGIGTGLPVLGFALVVMFGVKQLGTVFQTVTKVEYWVRRTTAVVMILVGVHLSLVYIFNVDVLA